MTRRFVLPLLLSLAAPTALFALGCGSSDATPRTENVALPATASEGTAVAIFAGGCFWCMEKPFEERDGVSEAVSGYIGGTEENPTYGEVSSGGTGHTEAVRVVYDPSRIRYEELLHIFWRNIDPTQRNGQFCDRGTQYRSGIFPLNAAQRTAAEASLREVSEEIEGEIVTEITDATTFYRAEDYHQDYYRENPLRYQTYRAGCGRDRRLYELWGESH
ncbi:MAG: peptide-methionine (S)-S-oxide reductase MsrA [Myxococcota bacterium]